MTNVYVVFRCRWHGAWAKRWDPSKRVSCPLCAKHGIIRKILYWLSSIQGVDVKLIRKPEWDNPPLPK